MTANESTPFLNMAGRIDRGEASEFGGALVLVAPDGKKVEFLLNNPSPNLVAFWGFVKACIEDAFNESQASGTVMGMPAQQWPRR